MALSRRHLLGAAATLALAGCASGPGTTGSSGSSGTASAASGASAPAAPGRATIGLTYIPNIQFAPFYVAAAQGLYAQRGAQATLRHHGASEALFTALAAGQEDFVVAGADEMLQARAQGMDLVSIAQFYRRYPVVVIVPEASAITSIAGLKGRTVGVPGKYGETWFGLKAALAQAGLTERDVTVKEIGYTQQAALTSKQVDAIVGFVNNEPVAFAAAGVGVRTIPLSSGTLPLVSIGLITTQAYLDAHPATAKAVVAASVAGFQAAAADAAGAVTASEAYVPTLKTDAASRAATQQTLAATIPLWQDASGAITPTQDAAQFAAMADFLATAGLTPAKVDAAAAMSNAYQG